MSGSQYFRGWVVGGAKFARLVLDGARRAMPAEVINLSQRLFFRISSLEVTLVVVGAGGAEMIDAMKIEPSDARLVFRSIEEAIASQSVREVNTKDIQWQIDATRMRSEESVVVFSIRNGLGRFREPARGAVVVDAITNFKNMYGELNI